MNGQDDNEQLTVTIEYATAEDLVVFLEHYKALTGEIQQASIQLANSPPLEPGSSRAQQRAEWRAWLELQITSKKKARAALVASLQKKGLSIRHLPE